ncbi:unnamed protein product, partial [Prorocentrum cordatum]
ALQVESQRHDIRGRLAREVFRRAAGLHMHCQSLRLDQVREARWPRGRRRVHRGRLPRPRAGGAPHRGARTRRLSSARHLRARLRRLRLGGAAVGPGRGDARARGPHESLARVLDEADRELWGGRGDRVLRLQAAPLRCDCRGPAPARRAPRPRVPGRPAAHRLPALRRRRDRGGRAAAHLPGPRPARALAGAGRRPRRRQGCPACSAAGAGQVCVRRRDPPHPKRLLRAPCNPPPCFAVHGAVPPEGAPVNVLGRCRGQAARRDRRVRRPRRFRVDRAREVACRVL